jgi:uncharacterized protein DUF3883
MFTPHQEGDWSREEVEATVADYLDMLVKELRGELVSKADHNRRLRRVLQRRSKGAVEFKHANISAVLIELGYPYIDGYKPRRNYQDLLREVVIERLAGQVGLAQAAAAAVAQPVVTIPPIPDVLTLQTALPRPGREGQVPGGKSIHRRVPPPLGPNYLEREARNRSLGQAGEHLILRYEHERLWRAGQKGLADRVEHVAETRGDHLGYDIQSFEVNGRDRLIEVKTTRFGAMTPFFATRNEVAVSEQHPSDYHLYRLYKFQAGPKFFVLNGSLRSACRLEPVQYLAILA